MILDKQLMLSDQQAVTATANSTNVLDNGMGTSPVRQAFVGEPMWLIVLVRETVTASGAATVTIAVVEADDTALTTNADTLYTTAAIGKATLVNGYRAVAIRAPVSANQRYIGVTYTVATGPLTAGKFDAFFVKDADFQQYYASGYSNAF